MSDDSTFETLCRNLIRSTIAANPSAKPGQLRVILGRVKRDCVPDRRESNAIWNRVAAELTNERNDVGK